jgi:hypothetical protein
LNEINGNHLQRHPEIIKFKKDKELPDDFALIGWQISDITLYDFGPRGLKQERRGRSKGLVIVDLQLARNCDDRIDLGASDESATNDYYLDCVQINASESGFSAGLLVGIPLETLEEVWESKQYLRDRLKIQEKVADEKRFVEELLKKSMHWTEDVQATQELRPEVREYLMSALLRKLFR